jgi:hypothetical protein
MGNDATDIPFRNTQNWCDFHAYIPLPEHIVLGFCHLPEAE